MKIEYLLLLILIYQINSWANALNGDVRGKLIDMFLIMKLKERGLSKAKIWDVFPKAKQAETILHDSPAR